VLCVKSIAPSSVECRALRLVFFCFLPKTERFMFKSAKISKACTIKYHTKKYSNLHMVRISHFSLCRKSTKISFQKKRKTSRDFNFAVTTQCNFYTFVVTSFGKQKIKICNLGFFFRL
jgi:hypothetical protein